ncbi:MAG TPA: cytochrome C class I protein [Prolixibacteraceae bacterium]|jgi:mono/diheme cytochrome c family protein|nr:cytochrome C class I protein [Prolixibacteraceae bacterium]
MKTIIVTILLTFVFLFAGFFIYISSGAYDISQLTPHNNFTKKIIGITTHSSINKRMKEIVVPGNIADTAMIVRGFKHYNQMCVGCHNAPGLPDNKFVEGWYPRPPELYKHVNEDDAQEFFWITKNGIKMTSMPAFKPTVDDEKIWETIAFVTQKLGKMTPEEYKEWSKKYAEGNKGETTNHE